MSKINYRVNARLLETLISLPQNKLLNTLKAFFKKYYDKITATPDYLLIEGNIPVALCAHLDTVFPETRDTTLFYTLDKSIATCLNGAGFDDRAGIYAIIEIIKSGLRPHIILTADEESGCLGARQLVKDYKNVPFPINYIIELDRRGTNDCVFYDCGNQDFIEYIEGFGFAEALGSFSDISVICPAWSAAGVNLSVGYDMEHSVSEILKFKPLYATIDKVIKMLKEHDIPKFDYIPTMKSYWYNSIFANTDDNVCAKCHGKAESIDMIPVWQLDRTIGLWCVNCAEKAEWCDICGEPYETKAARDESPHELHICPYCYERYMEGYDE